MFSVAERDRLRDHVLRRAASDPRVVAGAVVGSLAHTEGDRWSDLDLTFAVTDHVPLSDVLEDWTLDLVAEFDAVHLFDVPSGASIYRVFLLPGCLQFDLSFTPASRFGARGPSFRMLFGEQAEQAVTAPPAANELFGQAVHHALRARVSIERGRPWLAEYWLGSLRDCALSLACRRRGLAAHHGRGFDDLPAEVRERFKGALVGALERDELMRALGCAIEGLLREADEAREMARRIEPHLRELMSSSNRGDLHR